MRFPTEGDLVERFTDLFRRTEGLVLVWLSSQNIDRIVTLVKACHASKRSFIIDLYTALVLEATRNKRIPQASWNLMRVFLPFSQKRRIMKDQSFDLVKRFRTDRIYPEEISAIGNRAIMLFRPSMIRDVERMEGLKIGAVVASIWRGYLDDKHGKKLQSWAARRGIPLEYCHTSGHASTRDLITFRKAFPTAQVVPIHTGNAEAYGRVFERVMVLGDGEWYSHWRCRDSWTDAPRLDRTRT